MLAGSAGAAKACSIISPRNPTLASERATGRNTINWATAVIDGEVIIPFDGDTPALVRAVRVFKGPQQEFFEVGERTSCDFALTRPGMRTRMVLIGGPDVWYLPLTTSSSRYEDEILGSDRERDWPFWPGAEP